MPKHFFFRCTFAGEKQPSPISNLWNLMKSYLCLDSCENSKTYNDFKLQIEESNGISIQCFPDQDLTNQIKGLCLFIRVMPIQ
jgi:hypothetical protein